MDIPLREQTEEQGAAVIPPSSPGWAPFRQIGTCPSPAAESRANHPTTFCKSRTSSKGPCQLSESGGGGLCCQAQCIGVHGAPPSAVCLMQKDPCPVTYRHCVSGDIVLLAVLNHLLQVWAVVRLSICDYNHYSLCPFPATFLKRFRAAIEEMPWAAQPRQVARGSHCLALTETCAPSPTA